MKTYPVLSRLHLLLILQSNFLKHLLLVEGALLRQRRLKHLRVTPKAFFFGLRCQGRTKLKSNNGLKLNGFKCCQGLYNAMSIRERQRFIGDRGESVCQWLLLRQMNRGFHWAIKKLCAHSQASQKLHAEAFSQEGCCLSSSPKRGGILLKARERCLSRWWHSVEV